MFTQAPEGGLEGGAEEVAFQEGDDDDEEEATQPADHKRKSTELSADKVCRVYRITLACTGFFHA